MKKKRLILPLKRKWFEMIKSGVKPEEYREDTPYWRKRLTHVVNGLDRWKEYDEVEFTLGYPRKDDASRRMVFSNPKIQYDFCGRAKPEWGAEKGKNYFIITWDKK